MIQAGRPFIVTRESGSSLLLAWFADWRNLSRLAAAEEAISPKASVGMAKSAHDPIGKA